MTNFCGKCGSKLDENTKLCPNCDAKEIKKTMKKKKRGVFDKIVLLLMILCIFSAGAIGVFLYFDLGSIPAVEKVVKKMEEIGEMVENLPLFSSGEDENELGEASRKCIDVDAKEIVMENGEEGIATITIKMPDYKKLFQEAFLTENPEEYLLKALETGSYQIQEFQETARVTVENGKRRVLSEAVVDRVLEESLVDAINALAEEKR